MNDSIKIIRSGRRSIAIEISRQCEVIVRVPERMPDKDVQRFILSHSEWIATHLTEMKKRTKDCEVTTPFTNEELTEMKSSLMKKAEEKVAYYANIMGVSYTKISVRPMTSRWGSCTSEKRLCFNSLLDFAPEFVFDYVVVHELSHTVEMNHSKRFWDMVDSYIPDRKAARKWLRDNGNALITRSK